MNGLGILLTGAVGVLFVAGLVVLMRRENRHDDRLAGFPQPEHPGFGDIEKPPGIAHEPPWWLDPSETPPAGEPASAPVPGPGDAAAAEATTHDATPPASAPPPLPGHIQLARIAAHSPSSVPFSSWDPTVPGSDEFVEARAAYAQAMARYHTPLDGA